MSPTPDRKNSGSGKKSGKNSGSGSKGPQLPGKTMGFWVLLAFLVYLAYTQLAVDHTAIHELTYSAFREQVETGNIRTIAKTGLDVNGELREITALTVKTGTMEEVDTFHTRLLSDRDDFAEWIETTNPDATLVGESLKTNWWAHFLTYYLPFLLILALWLFFLRQMQGGGNKAFSFGKSKAKMFNMDKPDVTFDDVAGCDEAKYELQEIIDFLRSPQKFQRLGGRIPKGALLIGAPGTGKTLLGRAVAGEARVPFFSMSGSDFVEMFVGVGASRVRDLFEQGKKNAPCIIFIDEIDAVGRHRGAGMGGGHDEREQTLNQLLVEMDGFESNEGVILLAATNRADVLDPALLRPGRFDRQVVVDMPDLVGREAILKVHMKKLPHLDESVSTQKIAAGTPGMAGADLENLVNEAALLAARNNHDAVTMDDFENAKEKVMLGPERRSRVFTDKVKKETAYHEAGHAVVAYHCSEADPVHKVTIIPRGQALGLTFTLPVEDQYTHDEQQLVDKICMSLGGRVAEEIFLGKIGSGAYSDIRQVTSLARSMVTSLGMSGKMGPISYEEGGGQVFLGRDYGRQTTHSEKTLQDIDNEVRRIVDEQLVRARVILQENREQVEVVTAALLERETIDSEEFKMLMKGEKLPEVELDIDHSTGDDEAAVQEPSDEAPAADKPTADTPVGDTSVDDAPADDKPAENGDPDERS
ncbi:MAG: ATP-dependent zinc metalloprotease FtsH [Candidatus Krumholzibacteria bacterium]|nr:ATP-dependent zinc metalloprotease FtsH [Candidatus Krumholzibacteria bacterium]